MTLIPRIALLLACLTAGLVAGGCGGGDEPDPPREARATPTPTPTPAPGDDAPDADAPDADAPQAGFAPRRGGGTGTGTALLEDVRLGRHRGFDRVVFEFGTHIPAYQVSYIPDPVTQDGSGDPIAVAGRANLSVRFEPASSYDLDRQRSTFRPQRVKGARAGTRVVREAVRTGDFEAVLNWVIGTTQRVQFRTMRLEDPPRLVVDLRHP